MLGGLKGEPLADFSKWFPTIHNDPLLQDRCPIIAMNQPIIGYNNDPNDDFMNLLNTRGIRAQPSLQT